MMIKNYDFELLLKGRWQEAIPFFETAATIIIKNNDLINYLNGRANYWTCRLRYGEIDVVAKNETELT